MLPRRTLLSEPHGGRGQLIAGCRCPVGVKGQRGYSSGERGRMGPERAPGKYPSPDPMAPVASPDSCYGACSSSPGPRFATRECLLRTPSTRGRGCLHWEGGWSYGTPRSQQSQSLQAEVRPVFTEWKSPGLRLPPGGRVGQWTESQTLTAHARLRRESTRENPSVGVGSTRPRSLYLARNSGRPPLRP